MRPEQYLDQSRPPVTTHPEWGRRVTLDNFLLELVPAAPRHFNVQLPDSFASISFNGDEGRSNLAGDRQRRFERRPFEYIVAPPDRQLKGVSSSAPEVLVLVFDFEALKPCIAAAHQVGVEDLEHAFTLGSPQPIVSDLCRRVRKHLLGETVSKEYLESAGTIILSEILAPRVKVSGNCKTSVSEKVICDTAKFIKGNLDQDLSVDALATRAGCTASQFSRTFKKTMGSSTKQFVLNQRIEQARNMIVQTDMCFVDIAYATGFSSQSHMTSTFSRVLGVTPGALRDDQTEPPKLELAAEQ